MLAEALETCMSPPPAILSAKHDVVQFVDVETHETMQNANTNNYSCCMGLCRPLESSFS